MSKMTRPLFILVFLTLVSGCKTIMPTMEHDKDQMGNTYEKGYLLFGVTTDWSMVSIEIEGSSNFTISSFIKSDGRYYFLAPVPLGEYEIAKINLIGRRYFQMDNDEIVFSFKVAPNVISYVGELRAERSPDDRAHFELINRSSLALEYLEKRFPQILSKRKLKYTGPGKDDFFELTVNNKNVIKAGETK